MKKLIIILLILLFTTVIYILPIFPVTNADSNTSGFEETKKASIEYILKQSDFNFLQFGEAFEKEATNEYNRFNDEVKSLKVK